MTHQPWIDEDGEEGVEMSISELGHSLPGMLTWPDEPEARSGDIFVFRWAKVHDIIDGKAISSTFPDVFIRLTAHPVRHRKGHWQAPFARSGFDRVQFMRRGGGTTPDPRQSIDREVPLEEVWDSEDELSEALREAKRRAEAIQNRRPGRFERQCRNVA